MEVALQVAPVGPGQFAEELAAVFLEVVCAVGRGVDYELWAAHPGQPLRVVVAYGHEAEPVAALAYGLFGCPWYNALVAVAPRREFIHYYFSLSGDMFLNLCRRHLIYVAVCL